MVYNATGGSGWDASARVNWLSDKPMAEWAGVTTEEGYVTELDLGSSGLSGEIPARMGELTGLKSANLRGNELSGCIPANTRLRKALFQSYNLGRGPGREPGWDIIILHALHNVLIAQNGLEAVRTSDESLGWQDFLDATHGLGLAPCPPPRVTSGLKAYNFQTSETDKETHAGRQGPFRSPTAPPKAPSSPGRGDAIGIRSQLPAAVLAGRDPERSGAGGQAVAGRAGPAGKYTEAAGQPGCTGGVEPVQERAERQRAFGAGQPAEPAAAG